LIPSILGDDFAADFLTFLQCSSTMYLEFIALYHCSMNRTATRFVALIPIVKLGLTKKERIERTEEEEQRDKKK
jgi:hypothetical protein